MIKISKCESRFICDSCNNSIDEGKPYLAVGIAEANDDKLLCIDCCISFVCINGMRSLFNGVIPYKKTEKTIKEIVEELLQSVRKQ
jgi:hypothetical protein